MSNPTVFLGLPIMRPRQRLAIHDLPHLHEIDLVLLSTCNLSKTCTCCYLPQAFLNSHQKMTTTMVRAIVAWTGQRAGNQDRIRFNLLGGEPSLHTEFLEIVQIIAAAGHDVTLVSNGCRALRVQLAKHLTVPGLEHLTLGESGFIKSISLSADGPTAEVHDRLRGPGSFDEVMLSAADIKQCGIPLGVNWTVQYGTLVYDYAMVELARQLGADRLNIHGISIQGTARDRAGRQWLLPEVERRLWTHMNGEKVKEWRRRQQGEKALTIDCEAAFDDGIYTKFRPGTDLIIDTGLCNVRRPTGLTVYPDGAAITCPLHAEKPEVGGYSWDGDSFYLRGHPADEIAQVTSAGSCHGCPLYEGQPNDDGYMRLCVLTRTELSQERLRS